MATKSYTSHAYIFSCFHITTITFLIFVLDLNHKVSSVLILRNHRRNNQNQQNGPTIKRNQSSCSLFMGSWVHDESYPLYQSSNCPIIDARFNCKLYGRPDADYLKYRWQPVNCQLPRFNGVDFVTKMRGKTLMFVGDSLGRNQWESLICMIISALPPATPTQSSRANPLSTFKFMDYDVSISFYEAPFLVDIVGMQGKMVLKLDDITGNSQAWNSVDILSFNTGHWWTHTGHIQGWDYMEMGGSYYEDMDRLVALERGLRTWATWVDANVNTARTTVFFQSISPTHDNPTEWNSGGTAKSCYGETVPTSGSTYPGTYPDQMSVITKVLNDMHSPPYLLDITTLSAMRKDAHPSIYSGEISPGQKANPDHAADCSHWCLPGLPDTWNQLFYTALFY